jgi:hypothetical protein
MGRAIAVSPHCHSEWDAPNHPQLRIGLEAITPRDKKQNSMDRFDMYRSVQYRRTKCAGEADGEIYRGANMVLIWLGEDDAKGKSKKAMEIIAEFGNYEKSRDVGYQRHLAERVKDLMKGMNVDA